MSAGKEAAGPSTTLRSGRDDNSVVPAIASARGTCPCNRIVIPTGAKRSGGTCGFFPRTHTNSGVLSDPQRPSGTKSGEDSSHTAQTTSLVTASILLPSE